MSTDKLLSLQQLAVRWKRARYRKMSHVTDTPTDADHDTTQTQTDGSDLLSSLLHVVDGLRRELEQARVDVVQVEEAQHNLLVSVNDDEVRQLQQRFTKVLEGLKQIRFRLSIFEECVFNPRSKCLLPEEKGRLQPDEKGCLVVRLVRSHKLTLSLSLYACTQQLVDTWNGFVKHWNARPSRSKSIDVVPREFFDKSHSCVRRSGTRSVSLKKIAGKRVADKEYEAREQQLEMDRFAVMISDLVFGQDCLLNTIEHNLNR
ncbi:uncharacterized protein LOC134195062 [Corticium candelabrum]|uniref:uncharacterized protein LOC134195062 n=1 Tax=Corticium candelabrum TaxID=121492 RepID=UPI002E262F60|nr:uncharacterized protein LOC134195062 [Corticium candelabrum]